LISQGQKVVADILLFHHKLGKHVVPRLNLTDLIAEEIDRFPFSQRFDKL
jgi:hypothetical protein